MSYCFNPNCLQPQNSTKAKFCLSCSASLLLKDRYRGLKIIGQGSMGRTLLAVDEQNNKEELYCVVKQQYPKNNSPDQPSYEVCTGDINAQETIRRHALLNGGHFMGLTRR